MFIGELSVGAFGAVRFSRAGRCSALLEGRRRRAVSICSLRTCSVTCRCSITGYTSSRTRSTGTTRLVTTTSSRLSTIHRSPSAVDVPGACLVGPVRSALHESDLFVHHFHRDGLRFGDRELLQPGVAGDDLIG